MAILSNQHCVLCEGGTPPLSRDEAARFLDETPRWSLDENATAVSREFCFEDFYQTVAFVNAVAWIANQEGHHPDLEVSYNRCLVRYRTHAIGGLSENDFICAAKVDTLLSDSRQVTG
ncbi:MAG TPA: 4a-hydroxytetrahydrobiopterin dehydratase [Thermoanaerobaculaceae bacterium]|nr:4a-hydroxytetrahydrobiopterin dehydratase [Thermoanaerobaculaceae bacterium]HPS77930.1 4a-hydroxytetrahydrobiopterin dehydratase [Thermoanaerobaculaceae bacterium]